MKFILRTHSWLIIFTASFINICTGMSQTSPITPTPVTTTAPAALAKPVASTPPPAAPVAPTPITSTAAPAATRNIAATAAAPTPAAQQKDVQLGRDYKDIMAQRQQKLVAQQKRMKQAHQQSVAARTAAGTGATGPVPQQSIQQYYQGQQDRRAAQQYGAWSPQSVSAQQAQDYAGVQTSAPKQPPVQKAPVQKTSSTSTKAATTEKQPGIVQQTAAAQKQAQQKAFKGRLPARRMQRKAWRPATRKRAAQKKSSKNATQAAPQNPSDSDTSAGIQPLQAVPAS